MSDIIEQIIHTVDATIPDKDELTHKDHPKLDHAMLIIRNCLVGVAVILFVLSFFFDDAHYILRAVGYFCGVGAYVFECLLLTNCFKVKVPHREMFMVYCLGPLYLLLELEDKNKIFVEKSTQDAAIKNKLEIF